MLIEFSIQTTHKSSGHDDPVLDRLFDVLHGEDWVESVGSQLDDYGLLRMEVWVYLHEALDAQTLDDWGWDMDNLIADKFAEVGIGGGLVITREILEEQDEPALSHS